MTPGFVQTLWSRVLIETVAQGGLAWAVISPGSRSTPLAWAALQSKELRTRVVVDERCAAFFALGLAKGSGRATLLICTSGSAAAHYLPAVVEASESGIPLIILSADRPPELQYCGAAQTIEQPGLFGHFVRRTFSLGTPSPDRAAIRAVARTAQLAVATSLAPAPGPIHINVPLRKPLEPTAAADVAERALEALADDLLSSVRPPSPAYLSSSGAELRQVAVSVAAGASGFIALGPGACPGESGRREVVELALRTNLPVLAEAASGARFASEFRDVMLCDAVEHVLNSSLVPKGPHVVIQVGSPLVSTAYLQWLENIQDLHLYVICSHGRPDPSGRAKSVLTGDPLRTLHRLHAAINEDVEFDHHRFNSWRGEVARHNGRWWTVAQGALLPSGAAPQSLTEPGAIRTLVEQLPEGSALVLGNSLPIREVDWFSKAGSATLSVYTQRGANGIDGGISSACGIAECLKRSTVLILGDLSFLHDVGGLWLASSLAHPLTIVVMNNAGGRLFEHLPIAAGCTSKQKLDEGWVVPHQVQIERLALAYGLSYCKVEQVRAIPAALRAARGAKRSTVIEVCVDPQSTYGTVKQLRQECLRSPKDEAR